MQTYKSPLTIYVVWHPGNPDGLRYAEAVYHTFCRDVDSPLGRAIGIPVYFRYAPPGGSVGGAPAEGGGPAANRELVAGAAPAKGLSGLPADIDTGESERTAILLLVDDALYDDDNWKPYICSLLDKEGDGSARVFPVALSNYALAMDERRLHVKQFINLVGIQPGAGKDGFDLKWDELKSRLLHDLSRYLYDLEQVPEPGSMAGGDAGMDEAMSTRQAEPPVKLFISHAKIDGRTLAEEFRDYVNTHLKLKTFFDTNDIADAHDFEVAIKENVKSSAIVVFLSDQYSSREWCRIEVLVAKRNGSPLVVVDALQVGEKRSFPYLGNVPTIRNVEQDFGAIVDLALYQVLNNLFLKEKLANDIRLFGLSDRFDILCYVNPPELFNFIDVVKRKKEKGDNRAAALPLLVLYPDPPLGKEELNVLQELDPEITYITPSLIYTII